MLTFKKVLIIGAGTLGTQIAAQFARHGVNTTLFDISTASLNAAKLEILNADAASRVNFRDDFQSLDTDFELVIESITENLKMKQKLFVDIELKFPKAFYATNSSTLLPSKVAKHIKAKQRFCAYHFHGPKYGANIVDVMPHDRTSAETVEKLIAFTRETGLIPIQLKKENPSYLYNNILHSIMDSSVRMAIKGIASPEDIDRCWMGNTGMKIGPFGMLDLIGIDTAYHVTKIQMRRNPMKFFGLRYFKKLINEGKLGLKSGEGFYKYPNPKYMDDDFLDRAD